MTTHEQSVERAELLAKALESGEFKQGRYALREGDIYCCLGVANEVFRKETGIGFWTDRDFIGEAVFMHSETKQWFGFSFEAGHYRGSSLMIDNDENRKTFPEIAAIIRSRPEGLFSV